jgi:heptosyltransferase-3
LRKMYNRILVYRCGAIGDTIVALPTINALRKHFPTASMYLMTQSNNDGKIWADKLLSGSNFFDGFLTYDCYDIKTISGIIDTAKKIKTYNPDLVVYLANDKNSGFRLLRDKLYFAFSANCRFIYSLSSKVNFFGKLNSRSKIYPNEVSRLMDVLAQIDIEDRTVEFKMPISVATASKVESYLKECHLAEGLDLVAVCPSSKMESKRWPVDRFGEIGRKLISRNNVNLIVIGGSHELEASKTLRDCWPVGRFAIAAGRFGIMESAEILRRCHLYVGNDTGAMHIAASVGTPCVAIFSSRDLPESWYPWGNQHSCIREQIACEGCFLESCSSLDCMKSISVENVYSACSQILANAKCESL